MFRVPKMVDTQPLTGVGSPEVRAAGMDAMMLSCVVLNSFREGVILPRRRDWGAA